MTLAEFAQSAGATIERTAAREWGGSYAYRTADAPNCLMCGYRSERAALRAWATDTFGERAALALIKLLKG